MAQITKNGILNLATVFSQKNGETPDANHTDNSTDIKQDMVKIIGKLANVPYAIAPIIEFIGALVPDSLSKNLNNSVNGKININTVNISKELLTNS